MRGYRDTSGRRRSAPRTTVAAILRSMGAEASGPPLPSVRVVRRGDPVAVERPAELITEGGTTVPLGRLLPADLPTGYHRLRDLEDGAETRLILSPGTCRPPAGSGWGWAVQLYALRSRTSWGMGDLADLGRLGAWSAGQGAGLLVLNPLHAPAPNLPQEPSPYFPSSRRFRNPLYLAIHEVPGAGRLGADLEPLAAAGLALNADPHIDRDVIFRLKMGALEKLWEAFPGSPAFDAYRGTDGLEDYSTFCALAEEHGPAWRRWPVALRLPASVAVAEFKRGRAHRIGFHAWLQWLIEGQLARAAAGVPLIHDLAIGFSIDGADAWLWQDLLAQEMEVGAPPDAFNSLGQNWSLPPFDPWRLRAAGYEPFIQTLRASLRHAAGLRIDHVMGLFRLFWIPRGTGPSEGAYVRYPFRDLLDILALECERAQAFVVGEDLGTVEESIRAELAGRSVLTYRVFWFERRPPAGYPSRALAALTTHDLPTLAGVWSGADLRLQEDLGLAPNREGLEAMRRRLRSVTGLEAGAPVETVTEAVHRSLAAAPSLLVAATLEDMLGVEERANLPGTTTERENWSLALPETVEEIEADPRAAALAAALARPGAHDVEPRSTASRPGSAP